jgi:hypothetical protein
VRLVNAHHLPDVRTPAKADHPVCMNVDTSTGSTNMSPKTWLRSLAGPTKNPRPSRTGSVSSLTIRYATADDAEALRRLAALDSARQPQGAVLVAEVAGEPWAAISLEDYHAVADPFRPSGELVWLLVERARDLERAQPGRGGRKGKGRALRLRTAPAR